MSDSQKSLETLQEIRLLMERSTRFLSLSGLSGVFIGIYALLAAGYIGWRTNFQADWLEQILRTNQIHTIQFILLGTLLLSLLTGIWFTYKKAHGLTWDTPTRQLVFHLGIPLVTGGILCLIWQSQDYWTLILPSTLLFYGLALLNASKYTWEDLQYMGLGMIAAGLLAFLWPNYALLCWGFGFGVLHILYGLSIYLKYEK